MFVIMSWNRIQWADKEVSIQRSGIFTILPSNIKFQSKNKKKEEMWYLGDHKDSLCVISIGDIVFYKEAVSSLPKVQVQLFLFNFRQERPGRNLTYG